MPRREEREYHLAHGIVTESWSPLGAGGISSETRCSPTWPKHTGRRRPVVLRWHEQLGCVAIPRTSKPERLPENLDVFDFELTAEELELIEGLDRHGEDAVDSDRFGH